LFWSARSLEYENEEAGALERYHQLARLYPDNYWAAESLYRIVMLERKAHNATAAREAYKQLLRDFPENSWARKLVKTSDVNR
jgi:TolA-binding protein